MTPSALWIPMAAGGGRRRHRAVRHGRAAISCLVDMKAMRARNKAVQVEREDGARRAGRYDDRPQCLAGPVLACTPHHNRDRRRRGGRQRLLVQTSGEQKQGEAWSYGSHWRSQGRSQCRSRGVDFLGRSHGARDVLPMGDVSWLGPAARPTGTMRFGPANASGPRP
jgi:hypothetical protein